MLLSPQVLTPYRTAVVATGGAAFPVTSGQNLLLRAQDLALSDGANIATWNDTAGVGPYNLTAASNQPQLATTGGNDALPFVYFDTASNWLISNASYPFDKQNGSVFFVIDETSLNVTHYTLTLGGGITLVLMLDGSVWKKYNGGFTNAALTTTPTGTRVAILVTFGTGNVKFYIDKSTNVQSMTAEGAGSITGFQFGGGGPLIGKIFEARGWNRELSSGEVSQILDTWAPAVYGTGAAAGTPSGRVVFDGDSITMGLGATKARNWPYFLNPGNGWLGHNYAVSGQLWSDLITRQATTNTFANSTNWLIVNCGSNDVGGSRTGAQMETDFQTYMNAAIAAGFLKSHIVATTLSTTAAGAGGTARSDFNTWLRANYTTYAGFLFDLAADTQLGINESTNAKLTPANWFDGTHYTDAGYGLYASKIRALIGSPPF